MLDGEAWWRLSRHGAGQLDEHRVQLGIKKRRSTSEVALQGLWRRVMGQDSTMVAGRLALGRKCSVRHRRPRGNRVKMKELTPKQSRFVDEYLKDLNATAAYRRTGYGLTGTTGSEVRCGLAKSNRFRCSIVAVGGRGEAVACTSTRLPGFLRT